MGLVLHNETVRKNWDLPSPTIIVYLNEYIVRAIYSQSSENVATFQNILRKQNKVFSVRNREHNVNELYDFFS